VPVEMVQFLLKPVFEENVRYLAWYGPVGTRFSLILGT